MILINIVYNTISIDYVLSYYFILLILMIIDQHFRIDFATMMIVCLIWDVVVAWKMYSKLCNIYSIHTIKRSKKEIEICIIFWLDWKQDIFLIYTFQLRYLVATMFSNAVTQYKRG